MSDYDFLSAHYDFLAKLYSGGAILRAKRAMVRWVESGQSALVVGAGTALEVGHREVNSANWTLLDASSKMIIRARERFGERSSIEFFTERLEDFDSRARFDRILVPFFLNVFPARNVPLLLTRLATLAKPGGVLVTADFAAPGVGFISWIRRAHYLPPLVLFSLLTKNPWHELYDYAKIASDHGLPLGAPVRHFEKVLGLPLYETLAFPVLGARDETP